MFGLNILVKEDVQGNGNEKHGNGESFGATPPG
jgi:hypothetical protein